MNEHLPWNRTYHETKNSIHTESTKLSLKNTTFLLAPHGWVFVAKEPMANCLKMALPHSLDWFVTTYAN